MKSVLATIVLFLSTAAFAGTPGYDLKMELSMDGKLVSSPRLITKAGEKATIIQKTATDESFIEVIANEKEASGDKGISMKFVVGVIGKDGKRTILSSPQIVALENHEAKITVEKVGDKQTMSLAVTAKRKVL